MGYLRGKLLPLFVGAALLAAALAGCAANVSHPSALPAAASAPVAAAAAPTVTLAPVSPAPSFAASPSTAAGSIESPPISGTPTSAASGDTSPPTSADVIAMNVRATARAYIADFNIALATGDTTKIEALTSPTCGCRQLVNTIKQMSAQGQRYDGVVFTIKSIDVTYLAAGASGDVRFSISAGRVIDAAGNEVRGSSATPNQENDLFMVTSNGRWTVEQSYLLGANNR